MAERLDKLARRRGNVERSALIREAVADFLSAEMPAGDQFPRAVKTVWQNAVLRAFRDEGVPWTPMSEASFWDMDPNIAARTRAVSVDVKRSAFIHVGGPPIFSGEISWSETVNAPEELYTLLRAAISERLARERS